jgi:lycopene cyclase domain-containing protein
LLWVASLFLLLSGWQPGSYLSLELAWALPPIIFQLAFGADILWHYRRIVLPSILLATLYLSGIDTLAIDGGTWTFNPERSTGIMLGGVLPIEEALFFLLTNTLLVFGLVLLLANESSYRLPPRLQGRA